MIPLSLPSVIGGFTARPLGGNIYEMIPLTAGIVQTGAAITTNLDLPIQHKLLRVEIKHTDVNLADSIDALLYNVSKRMNNNIFLVLAGGTAAVTADIIETFGDDFPMGSTYYRVVTNTTNTDKIFPVFIIEALGG